MPFVEDKCNQLLLAKQVKLLAFENVVGHIELGLLAKEASLQENYYQAMI